MFNHVQNVLNHVQNVLNSCSQTVYILKTLQAHGLPAVALQNIYRSVVEAKVMYASSTWWGFISQTDRQRTESFPQSGKHSGYCPADVQNFETLCQAADSKLFKSVLINSNRLFFRDFFLMGPRHCCITTYAFAHTTDIQASNFTNSGTVGWPDFVCMSYEQTLRLESFLSDPKVYTNSSLHD
jgi:hypothetical protein